MKHIVNQKLKPMDIVGVAFRDRHSLWMLHKDRLLELDFTRARTRHVCTLGKRERGFQMQKAYGWPEPMVILGLERNCLEARALSKHGTWSTRLELPFSWMNQAVYHDGHFVVSGQSFYENRYAHLTPNKIVASYKDGEFDILRELDFFGYGLERTIFSSHSKLVLDGSEFCPAWRSSDLRFLSLKDGIAWCVESDGVWAVTEESGKHVCSGNFHRAVFGSKSFIIAGDGSQGVVINTEDISQNRVIPLHSGRETVALDVLEDGPDVLIASVGNDGSVTVLETQIPR